MPAVGSSTAAVTISLLADVSLRVRTRARRRRLWRAVVAAALVVAALGFSSAANAATACANQVIEDWRDNSRIDRIYDLPCYQEAIDAFPAELRDYTNFEEVAGRALQSAARASGTDVAVEPEQPKTVRPPGTTPAVDAASTTEIPVPVLVLAGMFVVLLGAGGLSHIARRSRERRAGDGER